MKWTTSFHHTYRLLVWNRRLNSKLRAFAYMKLRVRPESTLVSSDDRE